MANKCFKCQYFLKYFTKGEIKFSPTKFGWCANARKVVGLQDDCDGFKLKRVYKKNYKTVMRSLNDMFIQLNEIKQVLFADEKEDM